VKSKQLFSWKKRTERGCHNVLQLRTRIINDELRPGYAGLGTQAYKSPLSTRFLTVSFA
jgi:hypothetical protein